VSGYGSCKWTCGECGESYEASGVVGDLQVDSWAREHRERHRIEKLSPEEQAEHLDRRIRAQLMMLGGSRHAADADHDRR
jgi:hypothetical protein